MKATFLAITTLVFWVYGIAFMIVGFRDDPFIVALNRAYPAVALFALAGLAGYVHDALRGPRVPEPKRQLWAVVLVLAHGFAQPFYWWWYVRPRRT